MLRFRGNERAKTSFDFCVTIAIVSTKTPLKPSSPKSKIAPTPFFQA